MSNYGITGFNGHSTTCCCSSCITAEEAARTASRKATANRPSAYWTHAPAAGI